MNNNDSIMRGIVRNLLTSVIVFGVGFLVFYILLAQTPNFDYSKGFVSFVFSLYYLPLSILLSGIINGIYLFVKSAPVAAKVNFIIAFAVFLIFGVCMLSLTQF